jgi:hypothetical protein
MVNDPNGPHYDAIKTLYPEIATDPNAMARAHYAHQVAVSRGFLPGTVQWMQHVKWSRGAEASQGDVIRPPLTPEQRQAAEFSRCDPDVYAEKVAELASLKRAGHYRDR